MPVIINVSNPNLDKPEKICPQTCGEQSRTINADFRRLKKSALTREFCCSFSC